MSDITIQFGALVPTIASQLGKQGVEIDIDSACRFERLAEALILLHLHGIIPDSVRDNGRKRLMKMISTEIHKVGRDAP